MSDWYQTTIVAAGRAPALWLLVGFVLTYGTTRWVTLRIHARRESGAGDGNSRIKDLHIGGAHVHHQVWGILLVLLSGLLEFRFRPGSPWVEVLSVLFGVGAALALDEFALWLHLEDVYWSEEGRKSIDAVMLAAVVGLVLLVGSSPIGVDRETVATSGLWGTAVAIVVHIAYTIICLLKGRSPRASSAYPFPSSPSSAPSDWRSRPRSGPVASMQSGRWPPLRGDTSAPSGSATDFGICSRARGET